MYMYHFCIAERPENLITPSGMGRKCLRVGHIGVSCGALVMLVHVLRYLDNAMEMPSPLRLKDKCGLLPSLVSVPTCVGSCCFAKRRAGNFWG